jgi:glutamate 5-kinase
MGDRKWWIMHGLHAAGSITIDAGAYQALLRKESGGRLLAAGVLSVEGTFASQQAVKIFVRRRKRWESVAAPPLSSPYDLLTRSVTETPNYPNHQSHQHQHTASSSSSSSYRPPSSTFNSSQQLPSSSLGSASYLSSPNLNLTEPNTPNIIPAMSLSSSIASLDPLSRSNPDSPALIAQHAQAMRRIDGWDLNASLGGGGSSESVNGEGDTTARSDKDDEWELLEVGKGQANYNWSEMDRIKGCKRYVSSFSSFVGRLPFRAEWLILIRLHFLLHSDKIFEILGYAESGYVVESITIRERT